MHSDAFILLGGKREFWIIILSDAYSVYCQMHILTSYSQVRKALRSTGLSDTYKVNRPKLQQQELCFTKCVEKHNKFGDAIAISKSETITD